ncbi:hypothetical protein [Streptomyces yunnanensis]|uniref:Uncharacterized protein n=1 Tax=Streptomyces yunnanensis TaxID=156453 RepID=A0A9X8QZB6_9ACTN|nr:hypothetical protein [Streptomyces yunnanensis]SHN21630.1 hypothetical protein SAMN05216268_12490 [Streptomyces yunnanensis]
MTGPVEPAGALETPEEAYAPEEPPQALTRLARALGVADPETAIAGGPTFVFPRQLGAPGEWAELLSGAVGD